MSLNGIDVRLGKPIVINENRFSGEGRSVAALRRLKLLKETL